MSWAVVQEKSGLAAAMMLFDDRLEAEDLAREIRARGNQVVVRPYPDKRGAGETRP